MYETTHAIHSAVDRWFSLGGVRMSNLLGLYPSGKMGSRLLFNALSSSSAFSANVEDVVNVSVDFIASLAM